MNQEPGTNAEIEAFARGKYGAEYPMFAKSDVNGKNTNEVYKFCRNNSSLYDPVKKVAGEIPWNFAKFVVDKNGKVVSYHPPTTDPNTLKPNIEALLNA